MNCLDAALRFNQCCPKGSPVEVVLRSGQRMPAKTAGPAFVWAGLALVELEGARGPYQVEHVVPVAGATPIAASVDPADGPASKVA
jgi:hypothetical protein